MRQLCFLAALLLAPACRAGDDAPSQAPSWGMPQLMQSMAEVKSSKRKFSERKYLKVLTAPLESSGTLSYQAPARLEKHTLAPREEHMVLDHGVIVVTRAGQGKRTMMVNQYPAVGAFVESIRATLAGDLKALEHYYQVKLEGGADRWQLQLLPLDSATREVVREIRLAGRGNRINSVEIFEAGGDRSVMTVSGEAQ